MKQSKRNSMKRREAKRAKRKQNQGGSNVKVMTRVRKTVKGMAAKAFDALKTERGIVAGPVEDTELSARLEAINEATSVKALQKIAAELNVPGRSKWRAATIEDHRAECVAAVMS